MKIEVTSIQYLRESSASQIADDLRNGKYSLLETFGCHKMKKEMKKVGFACRTVLSTAEKRAKKMPGDYGKNLRKSLAAILDWGAPSRVEGVFPHINGGYVFGFNHPSLGEIIRLIAICLNEYPDRNYLFPVNIAWYEEIAPVADRLEKLGLYITPTITPSTRGKLLREVDAETMDTVTKLAGGFNNDYLKKSTEFIRNKDIVMIAPSAGRQATVFASFEQYRCEEKTEPQTMTLMAMNLFRAKVNTGYFTPITVVPPKYGNRGLNLFKKYTIVPCTWLPPKKVESLCKSKHPVTGEREFEHVFLELIANEFLDRDLRYFVFPHD